MAETTMGTWWLADFPQLKVPGYLRIDETHGWPWRLTVLGQLPEPKPGWDNTVTLFGQTTSGLRTLFGAAPGDLHEHGWTDYEAVSVDWQSPVLFAGDHVTPDTTFRTASFTFPHLLEWYWARLNGYVPPKGSIPDDLECERLHEVELRSGATLSVALIRRRTLGWAERSRSWRVEYTLTSDEGFSYADLSRVQWGLSRLHAIMLGTDVSVSQTTLWNDPALGLGTVEVVKASPATGEDWTGISPLFNAAEVDAGPFLRRWLDLASSAPTIAAAAAPGGATGSMQGEIQDLCNAVEWLFAVIQGHENREVLAEDQAILDAMASPTFSTRQRRRVRHLMTQSRQVTLEEKLISLASMMGTESAAWLLGSVSDWAHVISRVRNSLTHGFLVPGHDDVRLLGDAGFSLTTVLQFALLSHCGYINALCPVPGEMLWAGGQLVRGTRDAYIVDRCNGLATRSGEWALRATRLRNQKATAPMESPES